jgi:hypothetical protein
LPHGSIFKSIDEISSFFKTGSEGYSPVRGKECYQGMCLIPHEWNMSPLECNNLELSYFRNMGISDEEIQLDSVVIMRDIAHEWQSLKTMV